MIVVRIKWRREKSHVCHSELLEERATYRFIERYNIAVEADEVFSHWSDFFLRAAFHSTVTKHNQAKCFVSPFHVSEKDLTTFLSLSLKLIGLKKSFTFVELGLRYFSPKGFIVWVLPRLDHHKHLWSSPPRGDVTRPDCNYLVF